MRGQQGDLFLNRDSGAAQQARHRVAAETGEIELYPDGLLLPIYPEAADAVYLANLSQGCQGGFRKIEFIAEKSVQVGGHQIDFTGD